MANKKVNQLTSKPAVNLTDLFLIADPTSGQAYKTTISDLGTAIGSGVSSVNGLVGAVVLDTDDIQELVSPTNKWFTDTRARAALSASSPLTYNSGTGVFGIQVANGSQNGYLSSADWTTFNAKQAALSGTGFVKISGTTISYDNSTYLTTSAAASTYVPYIGANAHLNMGVNYGINSGQFLLITKDGANTLGNTSYFGITDTAFNNGVFFQLNTSNNLGIYGKTSGTGSAQVAYISRTGDIGANGFIKTGGTSSQFLKADGSVDSTSYQPLLTNPVTGTGTSGIVAVFNGTSSITDSTIYANSTRVSIGADVTTTNKFTAVSSTTSAYAVVAQASSAAHGIWSNVLGTGEIFRGQTAGGSYFIINNGGNAFLNGNLNVGDFASTSYRLNVVGTANLTGALSGTSATFSGLITGNYGGLFVIPTESPASSNVALIARTSNGNNDIFRWYDGATQLGVFKNSGSVGIGTASPSDFIDATSGLAVMASSGRAGVTIGSTTTTADEVLGRLSFTNTNSTNAGSKRLAAISGLRGTTNNSAYLEFVVANDGLGAQVMTLNQNGYLTVGGLRLKGSDTANTIYNANSNMAITCESGYNISIGRSSDTTKALNVNTTNGNIGVGLTGASYKLQVSGDIYSNQYRINDTGGGFVTLEMENSARWRINYLGRFSGYGAGALTTDASGNITAASDRTLKDIIKPVENVLENIMDFEPVYFKWNDKTDLDKENVYMSTIAQSIQKHYPDAVGKMADGTLTVQDRAVTAILVQAIKELTEKVKTLENK